MSATRSFLNAARRRSLPVTGDFFHFFSTEVERLRDDLDVLVAPSGEVHNEVLVRPELLGHLLRVEDRVRRLERRDDTLEARAEGESFQGFLVGYARVLDQTFVLEVGVLGTDGGIIQAGGDRVRLPDLALLGLEDVAQVAVQHAGSPTGERGPVLPRLEASPGGLHAHQTHTGAPDERVEGTDGVRAAAHAGDHGVRVPPEPLASL